MKKLLLPFLFGSLSLFAQKKCYLSVSGGADIRNATMGSAPTQNKPSLDFIGQFDAVGSNIHLIMGYEGFSKIKFSRMYAGLGYEFPLYAYICHSEIRTVMIPSIDASIIQRQTMYNYTYLGKQYSQTENPGFLALGLNLAFQWDLTDDFTIGTKTNILQRPDFEYLYGEKDRWVLSNYFMLTYKFNQN